MFDAILLIAPYFFLDPGYRGIVFFVPIYFLCISSMSLAIITPLLHNKALQFSLLDRV